MFKKDDSSDRPRYSISLQMDSAQDLIYNTSRYIYSKILMILFSN